MSPHAHQLADLEAQLIGIALRVCLHIECGERVPEAMLDAYVTASSRHRALAWLTAAVDKLGAQDAASRVVRMPTTAAPPVAA